MGVVHKGPIGELSALDGNQPMLEDTG